MIICKTDNASSGMRLFFLPLNLSFSMAAYNFYSTLRINKVKLLKYYDYCPKKCVGGIFLVLAMYRKPFFNNFPPVQSLIKYCSTSASAGLALGSCGSASSAAAAILKYWSSCYCCGISVLSVSIKQSKPLNGLICVQTHTDQTETVKQYRRSLWNINNH